MNQIRPDLEHTLSILPASRALGGAGGKIEIQGRDQTMIVAAIAVVTAEWHENSTIV